MLLAPGTYVNTEFEYLLPTVPFPKGLPTVLYS